MVQLLRPNPFIARRAVFAVLALCVVSWPAQAQRAGDRTPDPFVQAILRCDFDTVTAVLDNEPARVRQLTRSRMTLLHYAIHATEAEPGARRKMVELLLTRGANPNLGGANLVDTPLIEAITTHDIELVKLLLAKRADPNLPDLLGPLPLDRALHADNIEAAALLVNAGIDWNRFDSTGGAPLHRAAQASATTPELIDRMLARGADLNVRTRAGFDEGRRRDGFDRGLTPLHVAAAAGNVTVVQALLARGADVKATTPHGETPLHSAARTGSGAVAALLAAGADPNRYDRHGDLPLHLALRQPGRNAETIAALIGKTNLDRRDSYDMTPLLEAIVVHDQAALEAIGARQTKIDDVAATYRAAAANDTAALGKLLQGKPYLAKARLGNGWTPLHVAAVWQAEGAVDALVKAGAGVNARDAQGGTPLHRMLGSGKLAPAALAVVRKLLAAGADVQTSASLEPYPYRGNGWKPHTTDRPLDAAITAGDIDLVAMLLDKGAKLTTLTEHRDTPLLLAVKSGQVMPMIALLVERGSDINAQDEIDCTVLTHALMVGRTDIARYLIARGAEVNAGRSESALVRAARNGDVDIVKLLLAKGADVKRRNLSGEAALGVARDNTEITALLTAAGAKPDQAQRLRYQNNPPPVPILEAALRNDVARLTQLLADPALLRVTDEEGNTPLHLAFRENSTGSNLTLLAAVKLLLEKGADVKARNHHGQTPLFTAAHNGGADIKAAVLLLLEKGADPNARDYDGRSVLFWPNDPSVAALLIEKGTDPNAVSRDGNTALHTAMNSSLVVPALVAGGANVNLRDGNGDMPLHIALRHGGAAPELIAKADLQAADSVGMTPVQMALVWRYAEAIDLMMKRNPAQDDVTAAAVAAARNDTTSLKALLDAQPYLATARFADGTTLLHVAARWLAPDTATLLLARGALPNAHDSRRRTPIGGAVGYRVEAARQPALRTMLALLLDHQGDPNAFNEAGTPLLQTVMFSDDLATARLLLERGADPNLPDARNQAALHQTVAAYEIFQDYKAWAELLLEKGADLNQAGGRAGYSYEGTDGSTPLAEAIFGRSGEEERCTTLTRLFLERGADVKVVDDAGDTPLAVAARRGNNAAIEALLGKGATLNTRNYVGNTPLALAASNGRDTTVALLVAKGADVNARVGRGETPLNLAVMRGQAATVKVLLANKADINAPSTSDETPLALALRLKKTDIAALLRAAGATEPPTDATNSRN